MRNEESRGEMSSGGGSNSSRILIMAILRSFLPQVLEKMEGQYRALKALHPDVHCVVLGPAMKGLNLDQLCFSYIDMSFLQKTVPAIDVWRVARDVVEVLQPRIIYMRYPSADRNLLDFMERFPQRIVFEHQTIEVEEFKNLGNADRLHREVEFGMPCLNKALALVGVTQEIIHYQKSRLSAPKPTMVLPNGINAESIPLKKYPSCSSETDRIQFLAVAQFNYWCGLDRLIEGLAQYPHSRKACFHLVGYGPQLERYHRAIAAHGLGNQFIFYGYKASADIDSLADKCQVGVGILAPHRKGLLETTALKHREYCLRGLPFFFAGKDPDFPESLPFIHSIPSDEKPIDFPEIASFARRAGQEEKMSTAAREYGLTQLSWEKKMKGLLDFFHKLSLGSEQSKSLLQEKAYSQSSSAAVDSLIQAYIHEGIAHLKGKPSLSEREKYQLGSLYRKRNDPERALALFEELSRTCEDPELRPGIHFHIGQIHLSMGRKEKAVEAMNRCLQSNPAHQAAKATLEKMA
jgi:tetratricopeptide (TPR) repeat protein